MEDEQSFGGHASTQGQATPPTSFDDDDLARRYGAYASYHTAAAPFYVDYHGEDPEQEVARLLELHAGGDSHVLDIGCGTGQTLCRLAAHVKEVWGFEQNPELLQVAHRRVAAESVTNATLVEGNVTVVGDMARLPTAYFDVVLSQRGPNLNEALVATLRASAIVIQILVSNLDAYPLREIFGRVKDARYLGTDHAMILHNYAMLGLATVSVKEYFYDEYFRDADHLAAYLSEGALLNIWWLPPQPYDAAVDRAALDLYVRYHTTDKGVHLLRQRKIFVLHSTRPNGT